MLLPMSRVRTQTLTALERRVCLCCGYRGPELQRTAPVEVFLCPACGADLYARPPRSYADMEGFDPEPAWRPRSAEYQSRGPLAAAGRNRRGVAAWIRRLARIIRLALLRR